MGFLYPFPCRPGYLTSIIVRHVRKGLRFNNCLPVFRTITFVRRGCLATTFKRNVGNDPRLHFPSQAFLHFLVTRHVFGVEEKGVQVVGLLLLRVI